MDKSLPRAGSRVRELRAYGWGLLFVAMVYLFLANGLALDLFEHSAHDSYTLQAMRWREGHIALAQDYDWLELAYYDGGIYVSFPPFPTVPMLLLTFLFGANTPSMLVNFLMLLGSYSVGFCMARRLRRGPATAACMAAFWVAGCNLMEVSLYGGVWNMAQGMSFLLTMLAAYGAVRGTRAWRYAGPICIACAVGCRPFQAAYVPFVLLALYRAVRRERRAGVWDALVHMIPYVVVPALIAVAYGAYNYVRFDNVLEFGHNYLPEFVEAENGQFSLAYVGKNIRNILRLPYLSNGRLDFPRAYGFAFYLANPLFLIAAGRLIEGAWKRRLRAEDAVLAASAGVHFFLLLLHKSFGAWQFGTRYLIDLLPMLGLLALRGERRVRFWEGALMILGICFNAYGTILFHLT